MSKQMTPCEKLGYKVGDKFEVVSHHAFKNGQVVTLHKDDGTECPLFAGDGGSAGVFDGVECSFATLNQHVRKIANKLKPAKQALADAIHQNGGWPESELLDFATSNAFGEVLCSESHPERKGNVWVNGDYYRLISCIKGTIANWHQTILSRDEYYQAYPKADADGWIEWKGGECPVDGGDQVDYKLLSGSVVTIGEIAGDLKWSHEFSTANIIAYRLHKPDVKPEFCESVMRSIPEPDADDAESRLSKALEMVKAAAPHLLSDKYKFNGNEIMGERKPTIEQLAQDYRNAKGYADRLQKEAGEAAAKAEEFAVEIRKKLLELQELIGIPNPEKEHELEITDWRDLMVGDEVECTKYATAYRFGVVCRIDESSEEQPIMVNHGDGKGTSWPSSWKFIRRP